VIGQRRECAVFVIQAFGLTAAVNQIAFNWSAFLRALGRTRPIAVASYVLLAGTAIFTVPLLLLDAVAGYAVGIGLAKLLVIITLLIYLSDLFSVRAVIWNSLRGALPTLPALAAVCAVRYADPGVVRPGPRDPGAGRLRGCGGVATLYAERALLAELIGYIRRGRSNAEVAPV
jgi:hypothetical protein